MWRLVFFPSVFICIAGFVIANEKNDVYWMKIQAANKYERSAIADLGVAIEEVMDDYVIAYGNREELDTLKERSQLLSYYLYDPYTKDFPAEDEAYHNYNENNTLLSDLAAQNPSFVQLISMGASFEQRMIPGLIISTNPNNDLSKPGILFLGTHHAREHLSNEMVLGLIEYLIDKYKAGDPQVTRLVQGRAIYLFPLVNPDGSEYDISTGHYKSWRKNRRPIPGSQYFGTDLNRNYSYQWGTGGSSSNPHSDTYKGEAPFSEPETRAVRDWVNTHNNITVLISFHTYSKLILYPWGHKYDSISDQQDQMVHVTMAQRMSEWNQYKPEQTSDLYIASGDTTDWAYGEHRIFSFTFELDPSFGGGGFYPGGNIIPDVVEKNIQPCLFAADLADNPYRVLTPTHEQYGLYWLKF